MRLGGETSHLDDGHRPLVEALGEIEVEQLHMVDAFRARPPLGQVAAIAGPKERHRADQAATVQVDRRAPNARNRPLVVTRRLSS
jgi:hypothetical protein